MFTHEPRLTHTARPRRFDVQLLQGTDEIRPDQAQEHAAEALDRLEAGTLSFTPQPDDGVTYAAKISNDETRVDWSNTSAAVHNHVRGLSPFPGAWFFADLGKGPERIKLIATEPVDGTGAPGTLIGLDGTVACGDGGVRLIAVQRAGSKAMAFADFARGARLNAGLRFT